MDLSSSKRAKAPNVNHAVASCLVDGCESDLSQSREYHRRHKVCEPHSKTPCVTIAGRHQRFCQQCSRFHSLEEFDEGKRSCRKRLDGHNRRRRKPPLSVSDSIPRSGGSSGSGILFSTPQGTRVVSFGGGPQIYGNPVSTSSGSGSGWVGSGRVVKAENESGLVFHSNSPQFPISVGSGLGLFHSQHHHNQGSMLFSDGGVGALSLLSSSSGSGSGSPGRDIQGGFMQYGAHPFFPHPPHFSHGHIPASTLDHNRVSTPNPNNTTHNANANFSNDDMFRDDINDGSSSASGAAPPHQTRSFGCLDGVCGILSSFIGEGAAYLPGYINLDERFTYSSNREIVCKIREKDRVI